MLKGISWGDYVMAVALVLLVYYASVVLLFYRDELAGLLRKGGAAGTNRTSAKNDGSPSSGAVIRKL